MEGGFRFQTDSTGNYFGTKTIKSIRIMIKLIIIMIILLAVNIYAMFYNKNKRG